MFKNRFSVIKNELNELIYISSVLIRIVLQLLSFIAVIALFIGPLYFVLSLNLRGDAKVLYIMISLLWSCFCVLTLVFLANKYRYSDANTEGVDGKQSPQTCFLDSSSGPIYSSRKAHDSSRPYTREHLARFGTQNVYSNDD